MENKNEKGLFNIGTAIAIVDSIFRTVTNIFGEKVTPEAQRAKAGVWGAMLQEFLLNPQMTGAELAVKWKSSLPFKESGTKDRFVQNNLIGQSREYITNHLVEKINDEYIKGGIPPIDINTILSNVSSPSILPTNSDISPVFPVQTNYPSPVTQNEYLHASVPQTVNAGMNNSLLVVGGVAVVGLTLALLNAKNGNNSEKLGKIPIKLKLPKRR